MRTLRIGAVVKEWPASYSLWMEDKEAIDGSGYTLLKNFVEDPTEIEIEELFDIEESKRLGPGGGKKQKNAVQNAVGEVFSFFQGLSRL